MLEGVREILHVMLHALKIFGKKEILMILKQTWFNMSLKIEAVYAM